MEKDSFVLYAGYIEHIEGLADADVAQLFKAILRYANGDDPGELSPIARLAFSFIRSQMDRDSEKYQEKIEQCRAAGKRSGEARAKKSERNERTFDSVEHNERPLNSFDSVEHNVSVSVSDTDREIPPLPPLEAQGAPSLAEKKAEKAETEERFEAFWAAYPRKVNKKKVREWFFKHKPTAEQLAGMLSALSKQKKSDQWATDEGIYIPHPTTWLNGEKWNDELPRGKPPDVGYMQRDPSERTVKVLEM